MIFEDVVSRLNGDLLSKFILEDRIPVIVLALKDILSKDSISISTHLGKYKKSELLSMLDVDAAEFLACFLIYTCAEVANRNGKMEKQILQRKIMLMHLNPSEIQLISLRPLLLERSNSKGL